MSKEQSGKDILKEVKNKVKKQKETSQMKTSKKTIVLTVLTTILTIAAIGGLLYAGFQAGTAYEKSKNHEVQTAAQALTATISTKK